MHTGILAELCELEDMLCFFNLIRLNDHIDSDNLSTKMKQILRMRGVSAHFEDLADFGGEIAKLNSLQSEQVRIELIENFRILCFVVQGLRNKCSTHASLNLSNSRSLETDSDELVSVVCLNSS